MKLPTIAGLIERRVLVNYRIEPKVLAGLLPAPLRPQLVADRQGNAWAVGGICLIRLGRMRPQGMPGWLGMRSENAAHRFAVEWDDAATGATRQGVYIPRRDTGSRLHWLAGGRIFPGRHHRARFDVREAAGRYDIEIASRDDALRIAVHAQRTATWPADSLFASPAAASAFFEAGSLGYSPTADPARLQGLEMACGALPVEPLKVERVTSSYFEDATRFPPGSIAFDSALLMHDIPHAWHGRPVLCCTPVVARAESERLRPTLAER